MKRMLYYSETYYLNHGGRTHAREFFNALKIHKDVEKAVIFPSEENQNEYFSNQINNKNGLLYIIKSIIKFFIPQKIRTTFRLYSPSQSIFNLLAQTINKEKPDLLILRHTNSFKYLNWLNKKFSNLKVIVEFNASVFGEGPADVYFVKFWRKQEIKSLSLANNISVVSSYLKNYLIRYNPKLERKIIVNPNGVDIEKFSLIYSEDKKNKMRNELNIPNDAIVFGYIGGMEKFRRLPEVVEKFAKLRSKGYTKIFLLLIGNGTDYNEVNIKYNNYKNSFNSYFYSNDEWVSYEEVLKWISIFDVGIFFFTNPYGSPLKIFEYAACGLPIIGPDAPSLDYETGRELCHKLVKQDGSNFDEAVIDVYKNIDKLKIISQNNIDIVKRKYTWKANVDRILNCVS